MAKHALQVRFADGGAQCRCGVVDTALGQCHHIHITFNNDQSRQLSVGLARLVESVEFAALAEYRGLRGVQVFRGVIPHDPAAKTDQAAAHIANREHNAVAKAIVIALVILLHQHAREA